MTVFSDLLDTELQNYKVVSGSVVDEVNDFLISNEAKLQKCY